MVGAHIIAYWWIFNICFRISSGAHAYPRRHPVIAKDYFYNKKHQTVEIIKLNGSVELAPIVGLSEVIVDIVETGTTLKENGLEVLEEICPLSARVVVNQVSMKMENERINKILAGFKTAVEKRK